MSYLPQMGYAQLGEETAVASTGIMAKITEMLKNKMVLAGLAAAGVVGYMVYSKKKHVRSNPRRRKHHKRANPRRVRRHHRKHRKHGRK